MGLFGDLFREVASEIGTAIVDGFNEAAEREEEKKQRIAQYENFCNQSSMEDLRFIVHDEENPDYYTDEYKEVAKNTISARKMLAMQAKNGVLKQMVSSPEFSNEALLEHYLRIRDYGEKMFEEDAKGLFSVYLSELMNRKDATAEYEEQLADYYSDSSLEDIEEVIYSKAFNYDCFMKNEAKRELEKRMAMVDSADQESIDEMDNDSFMEFYDIVRSDETQWFFDEDSGEVIEYNDYFGKYRAGMLAMCEKEIFGSRRYLIEDFLEDFCEDEVLEFSNYSNKKLKSILDWNKEDITVNNYYNAKEFDKISKFIATIILKKRLGEED